MIKPESNIHLIKEKINSLKGLPVEMKIMRGRKKIENYQGIVDRVYNQIFTVRLAVCAKSGVNMLSYSYTDILCGTVEIKAVE